MIESPTSYLRVAEANDTAALARMRRAGLIELGLLADLEVDAEAFEREADAEFAALFAESCIETRLLVCDGQISGCASALFWRRLPYPGTSLHAELAGLYVAPPHRRHGFARALCAAVIETARERGVRRIVVHPSDVGRALYREFGFCESGQLRL